ncbi:hypothetical protein Tsubulata_047169 [Turnera subulata]|uniref:Uncharacterized protein n=1 Tax=Turnera subulata TaxID=218843 RepID=A0A9Q0J0Z9_9ROSI|nr:hypothetical protein Tsubulata_047169 [Turnera subulata]
MEAWGGNSRGGEPCPYDSSALDRGRREDLMETSRRECEKGPSFDVLEAQLLGALTSLRYLKRKQQNRELEREAIGKKPMREREEVGGSSS